MEPLQEELKCPVCRDLVYKPITLLCQHSLCKECAIALPKNSCPICNTNFVLPGEWNRMLDEVSSFINKESYEQRQKAESLKEFEKDEKQKIKDKLYREIYANVINRSVNNYKKNNEYEPIGLPPINTLPEIPPALQNTIRTLIPFIKYGINILLFILMILLTFPLLHFSNMIYDYPIINALKNITGIFSFCALSFLLYNTIKYRYRLNKNLDTLNFQPINLQPINFQPIPTQFF